MKDGKSRVSQEKFISLRPGFKGNMLNFILRFWMLLCQMAPYLLFGFLMAGIFSFFISKKWLEQKLGSDSFSNIFKASLLGVPMPLCSCSVLPVAMSMQRHGAHPAAVVSFLVSTPQTGIDSIFANYAILGTSFAIFRPIAAFLSGIFSGIVVKVFAKEELKNVQSCTKSCCKKDAKNKGWAALRFAFLDLPKDIAKPFLLGTFFATILTSFLEPMSLSPYLGQKGLLSIATCILFGAPLYICATASLPLAASLIHLGASPGAAVAFLMAGPATNLSSLLPIARFLGKKIAFLYLLTLICSAFLGAFTFDYCFSFAQIPPFEEHLHHTTRIEELSALILLALFALRRKKA